MKVFDGEVLALQGYCNRNGIIPPSRQRELKDSIQHVLNKLNETEEKLAVTKAVIDSKLHRRRCHDCGHEFYAADCRVPYCCCEKCRSQDTRKMEIKS